jgi:hypothetical protein
MLCITSRWFVEFCTRRPKRGRFCGDLATYFSTFPVSADNNGLSGGFLASSLCIEKFRSRRMNFETELTSRRSKGHGLHRCLAALS